MKNNLHMCIWHVHLAWCDATWMWVSFWYAENSEFRAKTSRNFFINEAKFLIHDFFHIMRLIISLMWFSQTDLKVARLQNEEEFVGEGGDR